MPDVQNRGHVVRFLYYKMTGSKHNNHDNPAANPLLPSEREQNNERVD